MGSPPPLDPSLSLSDEYIAFHHSHSLHHPPLEVSGWSADVRTRERVKMARDPVDGVSVHDGVVRWEEDQLESREDEDWRVGLGKGECKVGVFVPDGRRGEDKFVLTPISHSDESTHADRISPSADCPSSSTSQEAVSFLLRRRRRPSSPGLRSMCRASSSSLALASRPKTVGQPGSRTTGMSSDGFWTVERSKSGTGWVWESTLTRWIGRGSHSEERVLGATSFVLPICSPLALKRLTFTHVLTGSNRCREAGSSALRVLHPSHPTAPLQPGPRQLCLSCQLNIPELDSQPELPVGTLEGRTFRFAC